MSIIQNSDNYAIQQALSVVGGITVTRLHEFYVKQGALSAEYKQDASAFIQATLRINWSGETKKALTALFLELGFKNSYTSKLIEAGRKIVELERNKSEATDWVKSLPIGSAYVLATCTDESFSKIWSKDSSWGEIALTQKQLTDLKNKYDKPKNVSSGNLLPTSNLEKAKKLLTDYPELIKQIDALIEAE